MTTQVLIDHQRRFNCRNGRSATKLTGNTPSQRYQKLKLMYNAVRVPSSGYTMNLGALNVYETPEVEKQGVNWNQMSDRKEPHIQAAGSSGGNPGGNSTKRSVTRLRPGALSPGGAGVDIKHNSYDRYLAKKKANNLKTQNNATQINPIKGNKTKYYSITTKNSNCLSNC